MFAQYNNFIGFIVICSAKIHNLIEEVDPEDEVEEDLEDVSLVKKKKARVFRKGRKVHICGVCGLRVQDKTEMDR